MIKKIYFKLLILLLPNWLLHKLGFYIECYKTNYIKWSLVDIRTGEIVTGKENIEKLQQELKYKIPRGNDF
jgi:hypothetical protein